MQITLYKFTDEIHVTGHGHLFKFKRIVFLHNLRIFYLVTQSNTPEKQSITSIIAVYTPIVCRMITSMIISRSIQTSTVWCRMAIIHSITV